MSRLSAKHLKQHTTECFEKLKNFSFNKKFVGTYNLRIGNEQAIFVYIEKLKAFIRCAVGDAIAINEVESALSKLEKSLSDFERLVRSKAGRIGSKTNLAIKGRNTSGPLLHFKKLVTALERNCCRINPCQQLAGQKIFAYNILWPNSIK